jgi:polyisoprenoid-binding protein YceI
MLVRTAASAVATLLLATTVAVDAAAQGRASSAAAAPSVAATAPSAAAAAKPGAIQWKIDRSHSELTFRIRHIISRVAGTFGDWEGTITTDPADLAGGAVNVTIRTASITTNNERRDNHLRSPEFFAADSFPRITFHSRSVTVRGDSIQVAGDLSMRGVTKPVVLRGRYLGITGAPGRRRVAFEASTKIDRLDYGVSWNRAAEGGGAVLGDEVDGQLVVGAVEQGR